MSYKIGDKVKVTDKSYGFGIRNGKYVSLIPSENLVVAETGLRTTRNAYGKTEGVFSGLCDLMIVDNDGYYFIPSQDCESIDKKIEIRYFSDGEDVTDKISDKTKRNLRAI